MPDLINRMKVWQYQQQYTKIYHKVENDKVYTVEGNTSGDMCKQNVYDVGSSVILGYGTPAYK